MKIGTTIDYQYLANFEEQIKFNDKNTLGNYSTIKNNYTILRNLVIEVIDLLFKNKSESLISTNNIYGNDEQLTIDYYFKSPVEKQIIFNDENTVNNHTEIKNNYTMLKKIN